MSTIDSERAVAAIRRTGLPAIVDNRPTCITATDLRTTVGDGWDWRDAPSGCLAVPVIRAGRFCGTMWVYQPDLGEGRASAHVNILDWFHGPIPDMLLTLPGQLFSYVHGDGGSAKGFPEGGHPEDISASRVVAWYRRALLLHPFPEMSEGLDAIAQELNDRFGEVCLEAARREPATGQGTNALQALLDAKGGVAQSGEVAGLVADRAPRWPERRAFGGWSRSVSRFLPVFPLRSWRGEKTCGDLPTIEAARPAVGKAHTAASRPGFPGRTTASALSSRSCVRTPSTPSSPRRLRASTA